MSGREVEVARLFAGKDVFGEMQETGEGNVHPPPRQPLPRGAIPHRYGATECIHPPGFRREPSC